MAISGEGCCHAPVCETRRRRWLYREIVASIEMPDVGRSISGGKGWADRI
jgi:hypothetical protein